MPYDFPQINLTDKQLIWMKAIVNRFEKREHVLLRDLKIELYPQTGPGFDPKKTDPRLVKPDLITPTLLGLWHVNQNHPLIALTDRLLNYVKQKILARNFQDVITEYAAEDLKCRKDEIALCLELLSSLGLYAGGLVKQNPMQIGYDRMTVSDDYLVDAYLSYTDLPTAIADASKRNAPPKVVDTLQEITPTTSNKETVVNSAFVMMSMDPAVRELDDILDGMKEVFKSFGVNAKRVDDFQDQDIITDVVMEQIRASEFLIADLTYEKPNVYYEVGYAHAHQKRPILIAKAGTRIHFDLTVHKIILFENIRELKDKLAERLAAVTGRNPRS